MAPSPAQPPQLCEPPMAPNRPNPKEDPPAPSSSEEEEDDSSNDETSSEEELPPQRRTLAPHSQAPPKKPVVHNSDSDSEEDSDTDSGADPPPKISGVLHNVKPIASKPQPKAQVNAATASSSKRANESDREAKDAKRQKEVAESHADDEGKVDDAPRVLFQRLWGEKDEIAVLNGLIEFAEKRGTDPLKDMAAFYDFIKNSLSVDVSLAQLKEKVVRLRKKFKNHAKGKNGLDKSFSKAHDQKSFDLSKKIWDSQGEGLVGRIADGKSNGNAKKSGAGSSKSASKAPDLGAGNGHGNAKSIGGESNGGNANRNASNTALVVGNGGAETMEIDGFSDQKDGFSMDWSLTGAEVEDFVLKKGLGMVEASKRNELARRCKELDIATLELFVERKQLIIDQAQLILDSMRT